MRLLVYLFTLNTFICMSLMNRLESIYLVIDYLVLVCLWVLHVGSMHSLLQPILSNECN
jgi:hypothetical protein